MRILLIDPRLLSTSPAGSQMLVLARVLGERHDVTVIAQRWDANALKSVRILPVREDRALTRWHGTWAWRRGVVARLKDLEAENTSFDVVHSTEVVARSRLMPQSALIVATWHCCAREADRVFRSGGMRYTGGHFRLKAAVNAFGHIKGRLAAADEAYRARIGKDQQWVAVSKGTARDLESWYRPNRSVRVIHNGSGYRADSQSAEQREASRRKLRIRDNDFACLVVAQGNWGHKGLFDVLSAYEGLPDGIKLLVVGGGAMISAIEEDIRSRGLADKVILCGWQDDPSIYYRAADAFLQASYAEAFPLVAMEAANAGLPIATTRVNGVDEYLSEGTSALFMSHDPVSIRRNILILRHKPELRHQLGENARTAAAVFTAEHMARSYEHLYLSELRQRGECIAEPHANQVRVGKVAPE